MKTMKTLFVTLITVLCFFPMGFQRQTELNISVLKEIAIIERYGLFLMNGIPLEKAVNK